MNLSQSKFAIHCSKLIHILILWLSVSGASVAAPPSVIVTELRLQPFSNDVEALGTLRANESVDLMATVTDRVTQVSFNDGQRVKQGDVLVLLDDKEERAQLTEEQARLNEAQRQVERLQPLAKRNAATRSTLDEEQREVETASARIAAIEAKMTERRIIAPFDGIVGLRQISVGALAQPGLVLATIDDDSVMKLDFSVPEIFLSSLKPGLELEARTDAYRKQVFHGSIASIDSRVDPITRSVVVRALVNNEESILKPGMLMQVKLRAQPREVLVLPEEALVSTATRHTVFIAEKNNDKNLAKNLTITIGERRKGEVEVLSGLKAGDLVIVHGVNRIKPNQEVAVVASEKNNESLQELLPKKR